MAIDKIKLRHLAQDKDERFFVEGDILDALNLVKSGTENSTEGVMKNVKGSQLVLNSGATDALPLESARVVGSVSDDARGRVYFFVWSTTASNHGIYMYDSSLNNYQVVLRHSDFSFDQYGYVDAEVINGEFEPGDSATTQSIVYFTDNVNPPRKINIDRALATDLETYSDLEIKEFLSVIKTPSMFAPVVTLDTDDNKLTNDLYGKVFQFAVQYIYKDGEHSAISPHSKIVYPKYMSLQGVNDSSVDQDAVQEENLALIDTRWNTIAADMQGNREEIKKMRILGRLNNTSSWFVINELDPNQDLVVPDISATGSDYTVYTASSGTYRFYNSGLFRYLSAVETDRVFDDVPRLATSQAIVGNRLMYSAPKSGYGNVDVSATISVSYNEEPTVSTYTGDSVSTANDILHFNTGSEDGDGWFILDLSGLPSTINANSVVTLTVEYKPSAFKQWGYYDSNGDGTSQDLPLVRIQAGGNTYYCGEAADSQAGSPDLEGALNCQFLESSINYSTLTASISVQEDTAKTDYVDLLIDEIKNQVLHYTFNGGSDTISWNLRSNTITGSPVTAILQTKRMEFDIAFPSTVKVNSTDYSVPGSGTNDAIQLHPRAGNFFIPTGPLATQVGGITGDADAAPYVQIDTNTGAGETFLSGDLESVETFYSGGYTTREVNGISISANDIDEEFAAYDWDITPTDGARNQLVSVLPQSGRATFKSGCVHEFGVVYFDEHGRPGYVNELGSVYVQPFLEVDERQDPASDSNYLMGAADISIDITSDPPDWAKTFQIVYPGMGTYSDFETFTVGGAFSVDGSSSDDAIYLSLNTLTKYRDEKGALKNYTYTAGDKLRLVNYRDASDTDILYEATDVTYDVVGIETITDSDFLAPYSVEPDSASDTNLVGTFIKVQPSGGGNNFTGDFDGSTDNLFRQAAMVEILTPRKTIDDKIYYEIGEERRIFKDEELTTSGNNKHNDGNAIVITDGDVHYRVASLLAPNEDSGWKGDDMAGWEYTARNLESRDVSDFVESRVWSKGRPHVTNDEANVITYTNRVQYSEEYDENGTQLKLSSFNPDSESYKDLPKNYGTINFLGNYNQSLAAIQENKLSFVTVSRNVIEYADGAESITVNKEVLGQHKEASGDFGIGSDRSSALIRDGFLFFADKSRQKIMMANSSQLFPISDFEMSSYFEGEFDELAGSNGSGGRIVSGFDPQENMYMVTIEPVSGGSKDYAGTTVGFDLSDKRWISRYSFLPSNYASIDNKMLSGKSWSNDAGTQYYLFNTHDGDGASQFCTFYGAAEPCMIKVVSKISPSEVKVFNAISYEGTNLKKTSADEGVWEVGANNFDTNLGINSTCETFKEKEGSYYAAVNRDSATDVSNSNYLLIGNLTHSSGGTYTSDLNLSRLPIPLDKSMSVYITGLGLQTGVTITSVSGNEITFSVGTDGSFAAKAYVVYDASSNGDAVRGHFATIQLDMSNSDSVLQERELYCVNTHIAGSKLHHPKGQQ